MNPSIEVDILYTEKWNYRNNTVMTRMEVITITFSRCKPEAHNNPTYLCIINKKCNKKTFLHSKSTLILFFYYRGKVVDIHVYIIYMYIHIHICWYTLWQGHNKKTGMNEINTTIVYIHTPKKKGNIPNIIAHCKTSLTINWINSKGWHVARKQYRLNGIYVLSNEANILIWVLIYSRHSFVTPSLLWFPTWWMAYAHWFYICIVVRSFVD